MLPTNAPSGSANPVTSWYFSRQEIENNSPSRRHGISLKEETLLRSSYCTFLRVLGSKLKTSLGTIAKAILLCHRFFLRQSHAKNHSLTVATLCMFISAKIGSAPLNLKHVIVVSYEIIHKKDILAADERQEVYERYKEGVLSGEKLVLATLNFDVNVDLPFYFLTEAMKKHTVEDAKNFSGVALRFVCNCLWDTTLCLQYRPRQIAAVCFFYAAKHIRMDMRPYGKDWLQQYDVTPQQLNDIRIQLGELYPASNPNLASQGSIGGTSNSGDVAHQSVPVDKGPSSEAEGGSSDVKLSQSDDGSVGVKRRRPEGVEEDKEDSSVGDPAGEIGSQLEEKK